MLRVYVVTVVAMAFVLTLAVITFMAAARDRGAGGSPPSAPRSVGAAETEERASAASGG